MLPYTIGFSSRYWHAEGILDAGCRTLQKHTRGCRREVSTPSHSSTQTQLAGRETTAEIRNGIYIYIYGTICSMGGPLPARGVELCVGRAATKSDNVVTERHQSMHLTRKAMAARALPAKSF